MQNKGVVKFFAILLALVCLFQLSFTFVSGRVEKRAKEYAENPVARKMAKEMAKGNNLKEILVYDSIVNAREKFYLDSIANETVYNFLWLRKYTYKDVIEREINLGLDLKGGMNVTMEVSVAEIIKALSDNSKDSTFLKALKLAKEKQKSSNADFVTLFDQSFREIDPKASLASVFNTVELKDKIKFNSTNDEVIAIIRGETEGAIDRTFNILRTRIDRFGVAQPNIQKLQTTGRILIELPGIKDPERVRKLLQGTAQLEFWETYEFTEIYQYFELANTKLRDAQNAGVLDTTANAQETNKVEGDTTAIAKNDTTTAKEGDTSLLTKLTDSANVDKSKGDKKSFEEYAKENPLFAYLNPAFVQNENGQWGPFKSARVGSAFIKDTARVNNYLARTKNIFPVSLKLLWTVKPDENRKDILDLVAIKVKSRDGAAPLGGDAIVDANDDMSQTTGQVEVSMAMNAEGARIWKNLTADNIGKQIAIVLDDYVYSYPNVQNEIAGGRSSISGGNMTIEEAKDLANILEAGKLPAPAHIVQEEVVGPSLGKEAINAGMNSFVVAFIMILLYMFLYYNRGGLVANIALVINLFFMFGVLASFNAVLTLPGIAGIVLTLGMAVDANVIIYERILEEVRAGKGLRLALADGYKHALSAIIDGNVTTLLTGVVLFIFGSGPVQGFATTLIIGIISSMFSAILISRVIFNFMMDKNIKLQFDNKVTRGFLSNTKFDFIGLRKYAYGFSIATFVIAIAFIAVRGLNYGVDFTGGRSYVIRFDKNIETKAIRDALTAEFKETPEVKSFGAANQAKITTKYLIEEESAAADSIVANKIFNALKGFYNDKDLTFKEFGADIDQAADKIGILTSQKIGPTIAYDIKRNAVLAIVFSLLIIFAYIAFRFKRWQYGLGGVISLFHDTIITIGWFAIFYNVLPINLEVDQAFIAAILTIIGYSINDTVIIFDRIREYNILHPKRDMKQNMNDAINHTLARTMNTAGTTLVVLIVIFIFGGDTLRGFIFALLMGILLGTYSSVFNASPIAYDLLQYKKRKQEEKEKAAKK